MPWMAPLEIERISLLFFLPWVLPSRRSFRVKIFSRGILLVALCVLRDLGQSPPIFPLYMLHIFQNDSWDPPLLQNPAWDS